jgi:hypothetical protein
MLGIDRASLVANFVMASATLVAEYCIPMATITIHSIAEMEAGAAGACGRVRPIDKVSTPCSWTARRTRLRAAMS